MQGVLASGGAGTAGPSVLSGAFKNTYQSLYQISSSGGPDWAQNSASGIWQLTGTADTVGPAVLISAGWLSRFVSDVLIGGGSGGVVSLQTANINLIAAKAGPGAGGGAAASNSGGTTGNNIITVGGIGGAFGGGGAAAAQQGSTAYGGPGGICAGGGAAAIGGFSGMTAVSGSGGDGLVCVEF